jgi:hypothetical protein
MTRHRHTRHIRRAAVVAAAVAATAVIGASPAVAQVPAPHTISVNGSAQVEPKPFDKQSNASIKKAVAVARAKALPLAIADGRARAAELSAATGLPLGELISIADAFGGPIYFGAGPFSEDGSFGPDEYCGTVRRPVFGRDANGRRKVVRTRTSRVCRVPRYVSSSLTMVFSTP